MPDTARLAYIGTALPTGANTVNLYDSTVAWSGAGMASAVGYKRLVVDLKCDQNGTLKWYKSSNRGTNWVQIGQEAITAPSSTDTVVRDYLIEEYADFKLDWLNGGSNQGTFSPSIALTDSRNAAV